MQLLLADSLAPPLRAKGQQRGPVLLQCPLVRLSLASPLVASGQWCLVVVSASCAHTMPVPPSCSLTYWLCPSMLSAVSMVPRTRSACPTGVLTDSLVPGLTAECWQHGPAHVQCPLSSLADSLVPPLMAEGPAAWSPCMRSVCPPTRLACCLPGSLAQVWGPGAQLCSCAAPT